MQESSTASTRIARLAVIAQTLHSSYCLSDSWALPQVRQQLFPDSRLSPTWEKMQLSAHESPLVEGQDRSAVRWYCC
jgi:hypothetical protein